MVGAFLGCGSSAPDSRDHFSRSAVSDLVSGRGGRLECCRLMCAIPFNHLAVLGRGESLGNQQQHRQDQNVDDKAHYHRGNEPTVLVVDPSAQQVPCSAREKESPTKQHHRCALAAARSRADDQIDQRRRTQSTHETHRHGGIQGADCVVDQQERNHLHHRD